jgi:restriction endonuclease S subunit
MDLYQADKGDLVTSKINVHQGALALADRKLVCSTHYQVYEIDKTQINPDFLVIALRSKQLQDRVNEIKNKGIKNEQGAEFIESLEIPLPSLDEQAAIVAQIEKQKGIIEGVEKVLGNWDVEHKTNNYSLVKLSNLCIDVLSGGTPSTYEKEYWDGELPWISCTDITTDNKIFPRKYITKEGLKNSSTNLIPANSIIVVTRVSLGKIAMNEYPVCISQDSQGIIVNEDKVITKYLFYILMEKVKDFVNVSRGVTIQGVTKQQLLNIEIPLPDPETQRQIVSELDSQMEILEGLRKMKVEAVRKIGRILGDVWGVEMEEEIKEEKEE